MSFVRAKIIKIYFPTKFGDYDFTRTDIDEVRKDNSNPLSKLLTLISSSKIIGKIGNYTGVKEITFGREYYIPSAGSQPAKGQINHEESGEVIIITTYALNATDEEIGRFINEVIRIHPWEHPNIELYENGSIWMP